MTSINNINVHLTVIFSLTVPPLLAYNLSSIDVILLLLVISVLPAVCLTLFLISVVSNLITASVFLYTFERYCEIRKLSGSCDFYDS